MGWRLCERGPATGEEVVDVIIERCGKAVLATAARDQVPLWHAAGDITEAWAMAGAMPECDDEEDGAPTRGW